MNDRGYLMMEAVSSLLLLSCITAFGLPVIHEMNQEARATRQLREGGELLADKLVPASSSSSPEAIVKYETEYVIKQEELSGGFVHVCVSFKAANSREYERCGLKNVGMKQE